MSKKQVPIELETDGKLRDDLGLIPGGVGKSVTFKKGDFSVAVGAFAETIDPAKLQAAARRSPTNSDRCRGGDGGEDAPNSAT